MTEAEALEILGLAPPVAADRVRAAYRQRIRALRDAVDASREEPEWTAFEARLALLMQAQQCLLTGGDAIARTQELPRISIHRLGRRHAIALAIGALAVLAGLGEFMIRSDAPPVAVDGPPPAAMAAAEPTLAASIPDGSASAAGEPAAASAAMLPIAEPVVDPVGDPDTLQRLLPAAVAEATADVEVTADPDLLSDAWPVARLAELLDLLDARWAGLEQLPARTDLLAVILPEPGAGWRWQAQADGLFALIAEDAGQWLLAVPLLTELGGLEWACLSATEDHAGCHAPDLPPGITRRLLAGELDILRLARSVESLPAGLGLPEPQRWMYQAARQGYPEAGVWLGDALAAAGDPVADHWYVWAFNVFAQREAALDAVAVASTLARRRALDSRDDAAAWIQRCRQVVEAMQAGLCVTPGEIGAAHERAQRFEEGRWWYEQGSREREALSAAGLVRALALGRGGSHEPWSALRLLEEAWMGLDDFSRLDAGRIAGQIGRIFAEGWGVEPDPAEAAWWASHGGRLGDPEAALDLAVAFAVGAGIRRDLDRAEQVLRRFRAPEPLIDVRFERRLGRRLEVGLDRAPDPEAASKHYRRAWEICWELAESGMVIAELELAEMTLEGIGVVRSEALAAQRFEALLEAEPVRAGGRLAWILATADEEDLRDPPRALALARAVLGREQSPAHLETLAAALAANQRWEEAARMQRLALEELRASGDPLAWGQDIRVAETRMVAGLDRYRSLAAVAESAGTLPEIGALRLP